MECISFPRSLSVIEWLCIVEDVSGCRLHICDDQFVDDIQNTRRKFRSLWNMIFDSVSGITFSSSTLLIFGENWILYEGHLGYGPLCSSRIWPIAGSLAYQFKVGVLRFLDSSHAILSFVSKSCLQISSHSTGLLADFKLRCLYSPSTFLEP